MSLCTVRPASMGQALCKYMASQQSAPGSPPMYVTSISIRAFHRHTAIFALNYHPFGPVHPTGRVCGPRWVHFHACSMPSGDQQVNTDSDRGQTTDTRGHAHCSVMATEHRLESPTLSRARRGLAPWEHLGDTDSGTAGVLLSSRKS